MRLAPLPPHRLRLLRIHVDHDGRVSPFHPARHTEDPGYWSAVLSDPRARRSGDRAEDRLGHHQGEQLVIGCSKCPRGGRHPVDDLIVMFGDRCPCYEAAARIIDEAGLCRFGRDCGLTYETTKPFIPPGR